MTAAVIPAELDGACGRVRSATPADAVGGVAPRYVAAPASTQEASAVLRAAAGLGLAVVPRGAGTRLDWGVPPARCDLVVDMQLMDEVLEHAAGDLVARVQAGVRLGRLAEVLALAGQRLALDPPGGPGADGGGEGTADGETVGGGTVGGMIATGVAGPLRLRFGAPRDLLLGITMVRADGTIARAGGRVVKNVAGYDIGKLLAGSYGTLGLITEATFRLHPRPSAAAYVSLRYPAGGAAPVAAALLGVAGSALAPSAAELDWPGRDAPLTVTVLLEGDAASVTERAARLRDLLAGGDPDAGGAPEVSATPPSWWGRGAAAADGTVLRVSFWAGQLAAVLAAIRDAAAAAGLDPAVNASPGVLHAALPENAPAPAVVRFVDDVRAVLGTGTTGAGTLGTAPASAIVLHAPPAVRDTVDMWGPAPAVALMRAVKDQFDPEHRLAPARFAGGI
jgi:glycolate oxidase FAD binding subunit